MVEDDPGVRRTLVTLLGELGYRSLEAENGASALAVAEGHPEIELLLTDIVMPGGMNGVQLADRLRGSRPDMKVLYTSGYAQESLSKNGQLDCSADLLDKPYTKEGLARSVSKALTRRPHPIH